MTCFETGLAVLLDIDMWTKWADVFLAITTPAIALLAVYIAIKQLKSNKKETQRASAYNIYQQYLTTCLEYPDLARGDGTITKEHSSYGQYCWFISSMLFSFERVLDTQSLSNKWNTTIKKQLNRHRLFLVNSSSVKDKVWADELQSLIDSIISNSNN